jgi:hypothetical protein
MFTECQLEGLRRGDRVEDLCEDGRIMLKRVLWKHGMRFWPTLKHLWGEFNNVLYLFL